jgi:hypothetical protein
MKVLDTVANLAQWSSRFRKPDAARGTEQAQGGGALAQLETRLAGVVVAALKEAFDRDRARMDLEREHLEAERRRAEAALQAELRRQAAERALGRLRLVAIMAMGVWMLSAALGVWLPGMRAGAARWLLGAGWALAIAALGCAFAGWQRIASLTQPDGPADRTMAGPGLADSIGPWLLLGSIALAGAALLLAL